jgi:hypothetical protein
MTAAQEAKVRVTPSSPQPACRFSRRFRLAAVADSSVTAERTQRRAASELSAA